MVRFQYANPRRPKHLPRGRNAIFAIISPHACAANRLLVKLLANRYSQSLMIEACLFAVSVGGWSQFHTHSTEYSQPASTSPGYVGRNPQGALTQNGRGGLI